MECCRAGTCPDISDRVVSAIVPTDTSRPPSPNNAPPTGPLVGYIGNFRHPWCTEVHIAKEIRNLGLQVKEFQEPSSPAEWDHFLAVLEAWCVTFKPAVVMFTRTWGLPAKTTDLWRRLEAIGVVTCSYHLDLYVGLAREDTISRDPFWTTQYVFTPDGDPRSAEFFADRGINHHWLSPAVFSEACHPGEFDPRFDVDVAFVGSEHYHPEWPWRRQLIQRLSEHFGSRFRRFAGDMPEGPIREQDLNNLYATAKVIVGDSLALPGHINYWSDRFFETVGRGGFLLGPSVPGIWNFLEPAHMAFYRHPSDTFPTQDALDAVVGAVEFWLHEPDDRNRIRRQGQAHVRANHTYMHRLRAAFQIMGVPLPMARAERPKPVIDRLELGSGYHPTPGFTHLDVNPNLPDVDIVGPCFPLDLGDGCVGELRAIDVLEHLSYRDTPAVLADWFRVLAHGGRLFVQVPDAERVMDWFVREPRLLVERLPANLPQTPLSGAAWRLLGGHDDGAYVKEGDDPKWNWHGALFSAVSLRAALEEAGFVVESIESNPHPNLLCWARKP